MIDFTPSEGPTLGVEWEIALVDRQTLDLVPLAESVVGPLTSDDVLAPKIQARLHPLAHDGMLPAPAPAEAAAATAAPAPVGAIARPRRVESSRWRLRRRASSWAASVCSSAKSR